MSASVAKVKFRLPLGCLAAHSGLSTASRALEYASAPDTPDAGGTPRRTLMSWRGLLALAITQ